MFYTDVTPHPIHSAFSDIQRSLKIIRRIQIIIIMDHHECRSHHHPSWDHIITHHPKIKERKNNFGGNDIFMFYTSEVEGEREIFLRRCSLYFSCINVSKVWQKDKQKDKQTNKHTNIGDAQTCSASKNGWEYSMVNHK